jgi:hypothetical protein
VDFVMTRTALMAGPKAENCSTDLASCGLGSQTVGSMSEDNGARA